MGKKNEKPSTMDELLVKDADPAELARLGADADSDIDDMEYLDRDTLEPAEQTMPPQTKEDAERMQEEREEFERLAAEARGEEPEAKAEEEPEAKAEEEPEVEASSEEPEEVSSTEDKDPRIPHKRFEEVNQKRKDAEAKLEALEAELEALRAKPEEPEAEPEPAFDFDANEKEYMNAILEGEEEKALEIRRTIREAEMKAAEARARELAETSTTSGKQERIFNEATAALEAEYPILDDKSEDFDQEVVKEVIDLYTGYVSSGNYNEVQAINKATRMIMKVREIESQFSGADEEPSTERTSKKAVKNKLKVASQQPTMPDKSGGNPDQEHLQTDVMQMPEDEWDSLPESVKRRLRGDYVT